MKVYVDNYKKVSSWIWDFDKEKKEFYLKINFSSLDWDEPLNLLSLSDYTKQVRKEVCEEIGKNVDLDKVNGKLYARYEDLKNIMDKIQDKKNDI